MKDQQSNTVEVQTIEEVTNYAASVGADTVLANCCNERGVTTYELPSLSPMPSISTGSNPVYHGIGGERIVPWNWYWNDNSFPYVADMVLNADKDAGPTLKRKVNYLLGLGKLTLYKEGQKVTLSPNHEIAQWFKRNRRKLHKFNKCNAQNYCRYGNYFCHFILTRIGQIFDFRALKPHNVRPEEVSPTSGEIEHYYVFKQSSYTGVFSALGTEYNKLPAFRESQFAYDVVIGNRQFDSIYRDTNFIYHGGLIAHEDHFNRPEWLGGASQLELRRAILNYYNAGLRNGFHARYMILFHKKFYEDRALKTPEQKKAGRDAVVDDINAFLTGAQNAGKTIAIDLVNDHINKELQGVVQIKPIDNSITDQNYAKILERSDSNAPANFGINSILAGIERPGALSKGTEAIQQHNMHVKVHVPDDRATILEPIYLIFELNGWAERYGDIYDEIGFEDVLLESSNKNETRTE